MKAFGDTHDFTRHPIAPVGAKVLTWDAPDSRGTWADHGVEALYLGPAMDHLRAFEVWVPHTSASRITTVWWFLKDVDENLLREDPSTAFSPTRERPDPRDDGNDLIGRHFVEPELGHCVITGTGPIVPKYLNTRAQTNRLRQSNNQDSVLQPGNHYTLMYKEMGTGDEHYSSVTEIAEWIAKGPLLAPPAEDSATQPATHTTVPARSTDLL